MLCCSLHWHTVARFFCSPALLRQLYYQLCWAGYYSVPGTWYYKHAACHAQCTVCYRIYFHEREKLFAWVAFIGVRLTAAATHNTQNPKLLLFHHKPGRAKDWKQQQRLLWPATIERRISMDVHGERIKWKSSPFSTLFIDFSPELFGVCVGVRGILAENGDGQCANILPQYYIWWQLLL